MKTLLAKIRKLLRKTAADRRRSAGYSLAEVMVSGVLMTFSISAVVAVVGTGSQLGASDDNRRQARAIVRSAFEEQYDYRNFNTVPAPLTQVDTVQINPREGETLIGLQTTRIASATVMSDNGFAVPVKRITISLKWVETDSTVDSISLTKMIAGAQ